MDERKGIPSASNLHRLIHCLGSWEAEKYFATSSVGSVERDEGTDLHSYAEDGRIPDHLDVEQKWALRLALDIKESWYEQYGITGTTVKEDRIWLIDNGSPLYSGKIDEYIVGEDVVAIVDYKFGRTPVTHASENWQVIAYLCLLFKKYPDKKIYAAAIIQPRLEQEKRLNATAFTPVQLEGFYAKLKTLIRQAQSGSQPRTPSFTACEYCRALHVCPEALNHYTSWT